ncbi:MAG: hypothetical protein ACON5N_05840 [Akkermansiaceae bacterium]
MTSCGEEKPTRVSLMNEQAEALAGMAAVMNSVAEGSDPADARKKLESLAESFKNLKRELNALGKPQEKEVDEIANHQAYAEANRSFFEALRRLQESGKGTAEMVLALQSIHDPAPMAGEGSPQ